MNDFDAAYYHSQSTSQPTVDYEEIQEFLDKGYYVAVSEYARYCGVTDARLPGVDKHFLGAFFERSQAKRFLSTFDDSEDVDHRVRSPVARAIAPHDLSTPLSLPPIFGSCHPDGALKAVSQLVNITCVMFTDWGKGTAIASNYNSVNTSPKTHVIAVF